ncbi:centromere protein t [Anaeramoeba ignava]|uniref:Centromere protein t n=1 Tax=Anaeramoeba ignava TaxID=1746090 RepID=A0A9Q0LK44_ANAIG|nr:centromere protein t [Anaeramoeba ignava]
MKIKIKIKIKNQNQNQNQNQNENQNQNQNQNQNHKRQKIHSKPEFPRSLTRKIFSQFCKLRIEEDAMIQILKLTPLFFEQLSNDIHQLSNENDYISHLHFFSLMKNQRFISEEKEEEDLKDFIQKILPFELSEIIFPIARAGNKI